jgi:hypothetical protein
MASVVNQIENASLVAFSNNSALFPSGTTYIARRTPSLPAGTTIPAVIVCVSEEGPTEPLATGQKLKKYPLTVAYFTNNGHKMYDDETMRQLRDLIERLLDDDEQTTFWTAIPGFNRCTATGKSPYESSGLKNDLGCSLQMFTCEVIQARI